MVLVLYTSTIYIYILCFRVFSTPLPGISSGKYDRGEVASTIQSHCPHVKKTFLANQSFFVCFYLLRNTVQLRPLLWRPQLELVIHAFISWRLDYQSSPFTCLNKTSNPYKMLLPNSWPGPQKTAYVTWILMFQHWLPIDFQIEFKILVIPLKALHGPAPAYIKELLRPHKTSRS